MLPSYAPPAYADRETLWNALEKAEAHPKAQLAYSFDITLQNELTEDENKELALRFCRENFLSKGMIVDLAIHDPERDGIPNPHFHVLCPIRPIDETGAWGAKQHRVYELDEGGNRIRDEAGNYVFNAVPTTDWGKPETLDEWRKVWAEMVNAKFEEKGLSCRIDHRTLEEQGIDRLPTIHEGPTVRAMEKKGIPTEVGSYNRMIRSSNSLFRKIKNALARISELIAELKAEHEKLKAPTLSEYLGEYYQVRNEHADQNYGYGANKAKVGNLKRYAEEFAFLQERNLIRLEEAEKYSSDKTAENSELSEKCRINDKRIRELNNLLRHADNFIQYKPLVDKLNDIRWKKKREEFQAAHDYELDQFYMARRVLKEAAPDGKSRTAEWKSEIAKLTEENKELHARQSVTYQEVQKITHILSHIREGQRAYDGERMHTQHRQHER